MSFNPVSTPNVESEDNNEELTSAYGASLFDCGAHNEHYSVEESKESSGTIDYVTADTSITVVEPVDTEELSGRKVFYAVDNSIGDDGIIDMVKSSQIATSLTSLTLREDTISHVGIKTLINALKLESNQALVTLDLQHNNIGPLGAKALAKALDLNTTLTSLNIQQNGVGAYGANSIAKALEKNNTLVSLNLQENNICKFGAKTLARALQKNKVLKILNIRNNDIGNDGAIALASMLEDSHSILTHLDLQDNNIGDDGAYQLGEMLTSNVSLTYLNLQGNVIEDAGVAFLADSLVGNDGLTTLNLQQNKFGDAGVESLAEALETNSTLKSLNLQQNDIGDAGIESLAEALKEHDCGLVELNLQSNNISADGAEFLAESLEENRKLLDLNLANNNIGDKGADFLARAIATNSTLTNLNLQNNNIGDRSATTFANFLHERRVIVSLRSNMIQSKGAAALAKVSADDGNAILDLCLNHIGLSEESIDDLVQVINRGESRYTVFNLSGNPLRCVHTKALAQSLHANATLTTLGLERCEIGDMGAAFLALALQVNATLTFLDLEDNKINGGGAVALALVLQSSNTSLATLNLAQNNIGNTGTAALQQVLLTNTKLSIFIRSGKQNESCLSPSEIKSSPLRYTVDDSSDSFSFTDINLKKDNCIFGDGFAALTLVLETMSTVRTFAVRDNELSDIAIDHLAQTLTKSTSLTGLILQSSVTRGKEITSFYQALRTTSTLTTLDLGLTDLSQQHCQSLVDALHENRSLTSLYLQQCSLGNAGAAYIALALQKNTSLIYLNLERNNISGEGALSLALVLQSRDTKLTTLHLENNFLHDNMGKIALQQALKLNPKLTVYSGTVDLGENIVSLGDLPLDLNHESYLTSVSIEEGRPLYSFDIMALAIVLGDNTSVTSMTFARFVISEAAVAALSKSLEKNRTVTSLSVQDRNRDYLLYGLTEMLKINKSLTMLNLQRNDFGFGGASGLFHSLQTNTCLTSLRLENCTNIMEVGEENLTLMLRTNVTLTELNLGNTSITDIYAFAIADGLRDNQSTALTTLVLCINKITEAGVGALAEALKTNESLTTLDLSNNKAGDPGALSLVQALYFNTTLSTLLLSGNSISCGGVYCFVPMLKVNTTLLHLDILAAEHVRYSFYHHTDDLILQQALDRQRGHFSLLHVQNYNVGDQGAITFSKFLETDRRLTSLTIGNSSISHKGMTAIAKALQNNDTLTSFTVQNNFISDTGVQAIAQLLLQPTIKLSCLSLLNVSGECFQKLFQAMKINKTLTSTNLSNNAGIDVEGIRSLASAIESEESILTTLVLSSTNITDEGAIFLAQTLSIKQQQANSALTTLDLQGNTIGENGFCALLRAAMLKPSGPRVTSGVTTMNLQNNSSIISTSPACRELVDLVRKQNPALTIASDIV